MAPTAAAFVSFVVAIVCFLQFATAFNLGDAIGNKAAQIVKSEHLSCSSYSSYCDSHPHSFADVKNTDGVDVSLAICKVALGAVLQC